MGHAPFKGSSCLPLLSRPYSHSRRSSSFPCTSNTEEQGEKDFKSFLSETKCKMRGDWNEDDCEDQGSSKQFFLISPKLHTQEEPSPPTTIEPRGVGDKNGTAPVPWVPGRHVGEAGRDGAGGVTVASSKMEVGHHWQHREDPGRCATCGGETPACWITPVCGVGCWKP